MNIIKEIVTNDWRPKVTCLILACALWYLISKNVEKNPQRFEQGTPPSKTLETQGMTAQRRLFGTDGVRGVANIEPVTAETALKLGRAAAHVFGTAAGNSHHPPDRRKIVLGKDTRLSGYMLENAIVAGITSLGVDVLIIGPLPTPGVAYITRSLRADAGIVLSASHNPYEDNGIKFFRHDGYKLDDEVEKCIEDIVFSGEIENIRPTATKIGKAFRIDDALGRYVEFAKQSFPRGRTLESLRIAVDCANGAAYKSSPCILRELGAEIYVVHNAPNGTNINATCGSTYPSEIQRAVKESQSHIGITHDGDADRVLLCDENGELVDGDEIMAIAALDFLKKGTAGRQHAGGNGHEQFWPRRIVGCRAGEGSFARRSVTATSLRP